MKPMQKGHVLGKLMITIIGILPAIAFSECPGHVIRERVSEGLNLATAAKTLVSDNVKKAAPELSKGWTSQRMSGLTHFVNSIWVNPSSGVITIMYTEQANNIRIMLIPSADGASLVAGTTPFEAISWRCAVANASDDKYVPSNCRV